MFHHTTTPTCSIIVKLLMLAVVRGIQGSQLSSEGISAMTVRGVGMCGPVDLCSRGVAFLTVWPVQLCYLGQSVGTRGLAFIFWWLHFTAHSKLDSLVISGLSCVSVQTLTLHSLALPLFAEIPSRCRNYSVLLTLSRYQQSLPHIMNDAVLNIWWVGEVTDSEGLREPLRGQ